MNGEISFFYATNFRTNSKASEECSIQSSTPKK